MRPQIPKIKTPAGNVEMSNTNLIPPRDQCRRFVYSISTRFKKHNP